jgi:hypothetical protein
MGEVGAEVQVRNLVGFFLEEVLDGADEVLVRGRLLSTAGTFRPTAPTLADEATFLRTVALVR